MNKIFRAEAGMRGQQHDYSADTLVSSYKANINTAGKEHLAPEAHCTAQNAI